MNMLSQEYADSTEQTIAEMYARAGIAIFEAPPTGRATLSRRSFLKLTGIAGGGLTLAVGIDSKALAQPSESGLLNLHAFVRVAPSGEIFIYAVNPDMGQGTKTSLPMIVAEEMDAAWGDVVVEQAPTGSTYGRQLSGGSLSTLMNWDPLRQAGAAVRAMLVAAAAQRWSVDPASLRTENSQVIAGDGRILGYGELAEAAAQLDVPLNLRLKERSEYRLLGSRVTGVDNRALVTGEPLFGIDQRLPGMLYVSYARSPRFGGVARSANLDQIKQMPGITDAFTLEGNGSFNQLVSGVAIVGESTWAVFSARRQLQVEWDNSNASSLSWSDSLSQAQEVANQQGPNAIAETGDVDAAFSDAAATVESFYTYPFLAHATMEPQNSTAWYHDGVMEIWSPTQSPQSVLSAAAAVTGLPESSITVHTTRIGGGFGRRGLLSDFSAEAAAIAQRVSAPIMLVWTREEDMQHDHFRPGGFHSLKGAVDAQGKFSAWQNHFVTFEFQGRSVSGGSMSRNEFPAENIDNYRLTSTALDTGTPCWAWRAPGANGFGWVVQSFMHELAEAAGRDYREFLLEVMGDPRILGNGRGLNTGRAADVINLAAEQAGWGRSLPEGRALGLAFHYSHSGHVAEVAEVSVDENRKVTVHKVTVAVDIGPIVNLSGAENQVQGAVIDALSSLAGLEITMENGIVEQSNFHNYRLLGMQSSPPVIEAHFIQSDNSPTGLGEPCFPPLAGAVCNAIYSATGHRIRTMPITKEGFSV